MFDHMQSRLHCEFILDQEIHINLYSFIYHCTSNDVIFNAHFVKSNNSKLFCETLRPFQKFSDRENGFECVKFRTICPK